MRELSALGGIARTADAKLSVWRDNFDVDEARHGRRRTRLLPRRTNVTTSVTLTVGDGLAGSSRIGQLGLDGSESAASRVSRCLSTQAKPPAIPRKANDGPACARVGHLCGFYGGWTADAIPADSVRNHQLSLCGSRAWKPRSSIAKRPRCVGCYRSRSGDASWSVCCCFQTDRKRIHGEKSFRT
jgi:hypothetical protein